MPAKKVPLGPLLLASEDAEKMFMFQFASSCAGFNAAAIMSNASEAIAYFSSARFATLCLALIDLNLPAATGFRLLRWLGQHLPLATFPRIALTEIGCPAAEKKRALGSGATHCVNAPKGFFQTVELLECLKAQLIGCPIQASVRSVNKA